MARILVADDVPIVRSGLEMNLREKGYEVISAENAERVLSILAEEMFDLVILDVHMPPGMNGLSILANMRRQERTEKVPVIIISADSEVGYGAFIARLEAYFASKEHTDEMMLLVEKILH